MSTDVQKKKFREDLLDRYELVILEGMARTLWIVAYATFVETWHDDNTDEEDETREDAPERPGVGENWSDVAPETPDVFLEQVAPELAMLYATSNGVNRILDLFETALRADHENEEVSWGEYPAGFTSEEKREYDQEFFLTPADLFGYGLAMQAMGEGVSWFDDHAQFDLVIPRFEVHYDGTHVSWEGEAGKGKHVVAVDPPRIRVRTMLVDDEGETVYTEDEDESMVADKAGTATDKAVEFLMRQETPEAVGGRDGGSIPGGGPTYFLASDFDDHAMQDEYPSTRMREEYTLRGFSLDELREVYDRVIREYAPFVVVRNQRDGGGPGTQTADTFDAYYNEPARRMEELHNEAIDLVERYGLADPNDTIEYGIVWSDDVGRARLQPMTSLGTFSVGDGDPEGEP